MKRLIEHNPMLVEYQRALRRFLGLAASGRGLNLGILLVLAASYLLLLGVVGTTGKYMPPYFLVQFQTFVFCLTIPAVTHGAIAAEKEKRTWDVLAISPLTNREIVYGKFLASMMTQWIVIGLMAIPMLILLMVSEDDSPALRTILAEGVSLSFAICLASICLMISAGSKRAFSAQLICFAVMVVWLFVIPVFTGLMLANEGNWVWLINPFGVVGGDYNLNAMLGLTAAHLGVAAVLLLLLPHRLTSIEGDSRRKDH